MAAIPSWVPVRCLSGDLGDCKRQPGKQGRETKTASVTSATTSVGLGLNLNFDYDVGNRNRESGVSFSQASRFFWDQLRIPQGGYGVRLGTGKRHMERPRTCVHGDATRAHSKAQSTPLPEPG
ncbi:hypothetical protein CABS01_06028 [Colletotrichum abscissum]|uniref:Uncharacterized protein n=1 Tax=Colletotrichum abscissum TaxID=1671311 RepID=A0A9Q0AZF2_9PEZI|nr:uncharacterized protein CABS01_06028 [Colletotrichum abscissum]KAI3536884.1 hypothetical protein CABS02_12325 [Colletotrichum abscissum]KAK1518494.1 hypothetical protein CABS01_06028 [Colletotrichum abscissum]